MPKYKIELSTIESMAHVVDREGIAALTEYKGLLKNIMDDHARLMGEPPSEGESPASRTLRDQLTKKLAAAMNKAGIRDTVKKAKHPSGYRVAHLAIQALARDIRMGSATEEDNRPLIRDILSDHSRMLGKWFPEPGEIHNDADRMRDKLTKDLLREMRKARKKSKKKKLASEIQQGIDGIVKKHMFRPMYTSTGRFSERMNRPVVEVGRPKRPTRKKRAAEPFPFFGSPKPLPPLQFDFRRVHLPNLAYDWDTMIDAGDWIRHRGCGGPLIMPMDIGSREKLVSRSTRHLYNADIPKEFGHLRNSLFCCRCGQKAGRKLLRRLRNQPEHFMEDYSDFPELQGRVAKTFMYHVPEDVEE